MGSLLFRNMVFYAFSLNGQKGDILVSPYCISGYGLEWSQSISDPEQFWGDIAKHNITWTKPWTRVSDHNMKITTYENDFVVPSKKGSKVLINHD